MGRCRGWHGEQVGGALGAEILGGYRQAYTHHAAELGSPLTPALRARWDELAKSMGLPPPAGALTRREWLQAVYAAGTARK